MFKFLILFLVFCGLISVTPSASAHFVKSDGGVGAVLHVDPGDDPVAREESNIILEFKDTNNKFTLTNCNCRIIVSKGGEEILNQDLGPVASDQELSSVTPITFPEKNIYKLKVTGSSSEGAYKDFELSWDIRVERESEATVATENEESNWFIDHIIHLVGGGLIAALLIGAFAFQKRKIAVIILVLLLLGHSVPIKAIHASHDGPVDGSAYVCCLPVAADMPVLQELKIPDFEYQRKVEFQILNAQFQIPNLLTIRPPPF